MEGVTRAPTNFLRSVVGVTRRANDLLYLGQLALVTQNVMSLPGYLI
ncbi:hypothetical protein FTUN_1078 [Frigoriglobus tundricola]|uniref:Uncharacterized protein n=1 Tax=Frigoriglobus tundricola TaxID=2774151 RepID=A0A6M5YJT6_9BACT|nr:hypothetical protein FTUN_1078 [Frigoriglobus tundricola]